MVQEMTVGMVQERCGFLIDDATKSGFVIDPGDEASRIASVIKGNRWRIEGILLTHGHFDHIGAAEELSRMLDVPIYAYAREQDFLQNPKLNLSSNMGAPFTVDNIIPLEDGEVINLKSNPDYSVQIIHTPGHTPGSVTYYSKNEKAAFVGDTLIEHGPGMTHFPGGSFPELKDSIVNKILTLPADTVIYSGHSTPITVGKERRLLLGQ